MKAQIKFGRANLRDERIRERWNKEQREEARQEEDKFAILHITHEWNMRWLGWEQWGANEANHWLVPTLCLSVPLKLNYSPLSFCCRCSRFLRSLVALVLWVYKLRHWHDKTWEVSCISIPLPPRQSTRDDVFCSVLSLSPLYFLVMLLAALIALVFAKRLTEVWCVLRMAIKYFLFLPGLKLILEKPWRAGLVGVFFSPFLSG